MINRYIFRFFKWTIHKIGKRTLVLLSLLLVILISTSMGLVETVRALELGLVFMLGTFGLIFGWWLAQTQISGNAAVLLSSISGGVVSLYRLGGLGEPVVRLAKAVTSLIGKGFPWQLDWSPVWQALLDLTSNISVLLARLGSWIWSIVMSQPAFDPLAINLAWGLAFWGVTVWASWWVRRKRNPLVAVLPIGLLLAGPLNFTGGDFAYLIPVIGATSLLLTVLHHDDNERRWESNKVDYSEEIRLELYTSGVLIALALGVAAAAAPAIPLRQISQAFDRSSSSSLPSQSGDRSQSLGLDPGSPPAGSMTDLLQGGLPREHLLGSGPELSERVVMWISTGELAPIGSQERLEQPAHRYYWRALTYDRYTGRGWSSSPTREVQYQGSQSLQPGSPTGSIEIPAGQHLVEQKVEFKDPFEEGERLLFAAGDLLSSDQPYRVAIRSIPSQDENGPDDQQQAEPADILGATLQADQYHARSLVPEAGLEQLRDAGAQYPEWVVQRYLTVPDSTPQRVLTLSRDLTATQATPLERAFALETYLRAFPYTLDLSPPPAGRDVVDYFLFDLKRGYCDYYATAMVVLARAAGVPARLAVGYASGSYDAYNARYVITQAEAHSWPELYFPGFGWVAFEPTAGLPAIDRPTSASFAVTEASDDEASRFRAWRLAPRSPGWFLWLIGGFSVLGLIAALALAVDHWRLSRAEPVEAVRSLYHRIARKSARFLPGTAPGTTPDEFAQAFDEAISQLLKEDRFGDIFVPARAHIRTLTGMYNQATFSPHPPGQGDQHRAIAIWMGLRWRIWLLSRVVMLRRLFWNQQNHRNQGEDGA